MDHKKAGSILLGAALVAVIAAAAVLYRNLSGSYEKNPPAAVSSGSSHTASSLSSAAAPASGAGASNPSSVQSSSSGPVKAPDFTVYDADGNSVKLSDFRGKPVVLNFWASWCGYCTKEMPDFYELYKKDKSEINFLFVDWTDGHQETKETAQAFLKQKGYDFPVYYDLDQDAVAQYGLTGLPATIFIDRNGYFVSGKIGYYDKDSLEAAAAKLIG